MKKLKIGLFILFVLITTISAKNTYAATNNDMLISLGTGGYQITVYKTTTIDDIINVLGEPKLVTDSALEALHIHFIQMIIIVIIYILKL